MRLAKSDKGFSLVELLVVVVIIGILAAIAIPLFTNQKNKGYLAMAQADARSIGMEVQSVLSPYTTVGSGTPSLTFSAVSAGQTTLTVALGTSPSPTGAPSNTTFRVSPNTTAVAGGIAASADTSSGSGAWCIKVTSGGQVAVFNQAGLQSSTVTGCNATTGAVS